MKKFLLFAAAAFVAVSASAQIASTKDMFKKQASAQQKVALPQAKPMKLSVAGERKNVGKDVLAGRVAKQFTFTEKQLKNLKPVQKYQMANTAFRRAAAPEYIATGFISGAEDGSTWTTTTGTSTDGGTLLIKNMIPNPFSDMPDGVAVPYTIEGGKLIVAPTLVYTLESEGVYVFLCDFASEDSYIRLDIEEDGVIMTQNMQFAYAVFPTTTFDPTYQTYLGVYELVNNVKYRLPGEAPEPPTVLAQPGNTVLFAGLSPTGYRYNDNLAVLPAYKEFTVSNGTQDYASSWRWSGNENYGSETEGGDPVIVPLSAETKNFTFTTTPEAVYESIKLVGLNEDIESEEYTFGYGQAIDEETQMPEHAAFHGYAGGTQALFSFSDDSYATMTTQDPDGGLTFYTNWGTPDIATTSMSKIYCYQGKPAAPIYFAGVTLPFVDFAFVDEVNFNLHISIYKCHRSNSGALTLGDLIAKSDATSENVSDKYDSGLTEVVFNGFYVEDEEGMSEDVPYLQLDEEFVIVIEGWDNGTFSGVLGSQGKDVNTITSCYFARTGYPDELRRYTSWFPTLLIGLYDAVTGYLHTTDNTDVTVDVAGGQAYVNVDAMLRSADSEAGTYSYRLFIEDIYVNGESVDEIPDWVTVQVGNVSESGTEFTLGFDVAAMPQDIEGRTITIKFMQEGAFLPVTLTQGVPPTGISTVKSAGKKAHNAMLYNLAGQRVDKNFKGIVVKDGKKMMVK